MLEFIKNNAELLVWLVAIISITAYMLITCPYSLTEAFDNTKGYYKKYCSSCKWKSKSSCDSCTNCGYCVTADGYGECVAGDSSGPYFREDCAYYSYGDHWYNYPYGQAYPSMQVDGIYPFDRWNIRKERWGWSRQEVGDRLKLQARDNRELRARLKANQI